MERQQQWKGEGEPAMKRDEDHVQTVIELYRGRDPNAEHPHRESQRRWLEGEETRD